MISSVKLLGVIIDSLLSIKLHMEHIERLYILNRINITRFNSTNATLLICLHKLFRRLYMDHPCTALTTLNKSQRRSIEIIQTRFFTIQEE